METICLHQEGNLEVEFTRLLWDGWLKSRKWFSVQFSPSDVTALLLLAYDWVIHRNLLRSKQLLSVIWEACKNFSHHLLCDSLLCLRPCPAPDLYRGTQQESACLATEVSGASVLAKPFFCKLAFTHPAQLTAKAFMLASSKTMCLSEQGNTIH